MKYYEQLLSMGCFTWNDACILTGNRDTASTMIQNYLEKGYIKSVIRNLYVVINLADGTPAANRFMIASKINDSAYISHRSAFEYYGYADQVQNDVYVSSNSAFRKFEFDGFNYIFIKSRIDDGVIMKSDKVVKSDKVIESDGVVGSGGIVATGRVRVTDIEHTVIDCINDFEKFGGPEALLNSIPSLPLLDEEKLLLYLKCYNKQVLYQKTGYMLEHFKNELKISGEFFISCKKGILKSVHRLSMNIHKSESVYDKKWRLYVPEKLMSLLAEGAEFGDKYNDPIHPVWE